MKRINFSININAPRETVWDVLWGDKTYNEWTRAFSEGSHAVTDWKEGSKVLFLDGNGSGMVSTIAAKRPNEFMSFKHMGEVKNGVEDLDSDAVKAWAGSTENYTLTEENGKTNLGVDMEVTEEFEKMFTDIFPKALQLVKELSEK
ncbi:MAG: SRPBCC domain-containing protein [Flavobacteriales bacterium]|nr:SRPBCC domain-containing protein [Flavobacteriales bacterium]